MKKQYTIDDNKFYEGKKMITVNGGIIHPNGSFEVKGVKGRFTREDNLLTIVITDKPWLASWGMIGDKLDEFFG